VIPWDEILSGDVISLDTETASGSKPNPHTDRMLGLSIGWEKGEIYVPVADVPSDFGARLRSSACRIVGHNSKYDTIVLACAGWNIRFSDDTMLMAYVAGGTLPLGLKPLTKQLLGREAQELAPLIKEYGSVADIPLPIMSAYAAADARNTWDVDAVLYPDVDILYHMLEMPMMHLLTEMEILGWRVDKQRLSVLKLEMLGEQGKLERGIQFFGLEHPTKNQEGAQVLLNNGVRFLPRTPTRLWCTGKEVLKEIDNPLASAWLEWRHYNKMLSTWMRAMEGTDESSYIHSSYRQTPRSGRLSCANPNAQNFPTAPRACLVADPDCYLIGADCSQFELRIMAKQSKDPVLIEEFIQGVDIHQGNLEELRLPDRLTAKKIMFGISYGMDKHRMAQETGHPVSLCGEFMTRVFGKYRVLKRHIESVQREIRGSGWATTLLGRRRYLPEVLWGDGEQRSHELRAGFNHTIQGTAADLMKMAQIFLTPLLAEHGARVVAQIHDEFIISSPDPFKTYNALMETERHVQPWLDPVPFKLGVILGENWGECK